MKNKTYSVAITKSSNSYPEIFPFNPSEKYPEYNGPIDKHYVNSVYEAVRESLFLLGFDKQNYGKHTWNPLGHIIKPGNKVFIKPNLVTHQYGRKKENLKGDIFSIITHPSVIRAVTDYVLIALQGEGKVIIGDNPSLDANFLEICKVTQLDKFPVFYRDTFKRVVKFYDLRSEWCDNIEYYGYKSKMKKLPGDPNGSSIINLKKRSFFYNINPLLFRGVYNDRWDTIKHHHGETQEYCMANSIYKADVYISVPKLKSHHKVGATLNIKGLVGTCTKKNYLIHWRVGSPKIGGDEYHNNVTTFSTIKLLFMHLWLSIAPDISVYFFSRLAKFLRINPLKNLPKYRGSWEGNDTCWRMAADLYQALMTRPKKCFSVIDGIKSGEGNGPFTPNLKDSHTIISGENLIAVDCAAVRLMDYDIQRIKYLPYLLEQNQIQLKDIKIVSKDIDVSNFFSKRSSYLNFKPPRHWNHLSINS